MSTSSTGRRADELADALADALGGEVPPGIAALPPEQQADLSRILREAVAAERAALAEATDAGLGFVPAVLRGTVRKVLFG